MQVRDTCQRTRVNASRALGFRLPGDSCSRGWMHAKAWQKGGIEKEKRGGREEGERDKERGGRWREGGRETGGGKGGGRPKQGREGAQSNDEKAAELTRGEGTQRLDYEVQLPEEADEQ